jgi:PAS domain S-box-containing protein
MSKDEKEIRELRRLLRDLVALATTPAVWVGRDRGQIAEGVADVLLHTLRADAIYVRLQSANKIEAVRSAQHPGFSDEVRRLWPESAIARLQVDTIIGSTWPTALRVATQSIGISGDDGFIVVGCADPAFPNESQALLLSVAANQAAVALQAASLRAQAELERHKLQDLLARAPAAIGLLSGQEHRWIFVNENYIRVTGRKRAADFVGKTLRESLPEIETQPFIELLDGVYRTGKSYVGREMKAKLNRAQSGQPEEGYFDFVYEPLRNSEGVVDGIFVHAVEVTDKVLARQDIEKRERQFREMIDALPAAIYTTDAAGRLTHFNPAAVEFSGRTPELGTDQWCVSWKLFYPDGRPMPHDECPMAIALKEGRVIKGAEAIAECPDGTRRWFTPYPTLLRDDQGKIIGGINMLVDITARKQAEEATGYLAAIVSSSDDAILSKNLDGVIRSWNKSAERLFGYAAKEAIGKHITIIVPSDRRTEEANILSRLRRGERIDHFETVRMRKDGSIFDVSLTISPIKDSAGHVIGASNVARDISHLKRVERALRESEERYRTLAESLEAEVRARTRQLEERNNEILRQTEQVRELSWRLLRAQDEERRHIARELHDSAGQTLTVLGMNLAQFVQKTGRAAPEVAGEAATIQEMVQQLHRDIRTTSYLLHPPLLDESGLYSAVSWYTQGLVERSGLQINLDMSEDFGRLPGDMELVVFRLIQECLTNIHRHAGSKTASIRITRDADQVTVEVRDQGMGMPPERLAQVQSGASGVGIRGIRERLRQFKGEMKIESDSSGTRISVTIPARKSAIAQDESSPESVQAAF